METVVERDISYALYTRVMNIGTDRELMTALRKYETTQLKKFQAWTVTCDRQQPNERFYILDLDGERVPENVQNLFGKRYLTALNEIKKALVRLLAERSLDEVLADV